MLNKDSKAAVRQQNWRDLKAAVGHMAAPSSREMTLNSLLLNIKAVDMDSMICQTDIQTAEDLERAQADGFRPLVTETDFRAQFEGVDARNVWYTTSFSQPCLYLNKETLAACPFHMELMLAGMGSGMGLDNATFRKLIAEREAEVARKEYMGSIISLPDAMRLDYFNLLVEKKLDVPNLYELFMDVYSDADYGFSRLHKETVEAIIAAKTDEQAVRTVEQLRAYPDTMTIYRGGNSASASSEKGYSWTTDANIANFFAIRRGNGPAYIATAQVEKDSVVEYIEDRGECEILVRPDDVEVKDIMWLKGSDYLSEMLPVVAPVYKTYWENLQKLKFRQDSSIHGREHSARVLLLALMIAEELNLPMSDRRILATAAIYHDTQRTHDGVEPKHGPAAAEHYRTVVKKPDPLVAFLCEYHSATDEEGYQAIRDSRELSKNRTRAKKLLDVFKDADGLDRVRLGDIRHEMDMNQYRLPVTKELTLVARFVLENLRI